jgi:hypothetical protein
MHPRLFDLNLKFHFHKAPSLAPKHSADHPTTPPATLFSTLPALNPWTIQLKPLVCRLHAGLEARRNIVGAPCIVGQIGHVYYIII